MSNILEIFLATPVLIKVLVSLGVILLLNSWLRRLLVAIIAGTLLLAAWSGHGPLATLNIAWQRLSSADNLLLLVIVFQVVWLSSQMGVTGVMGDLVGAVKNHLSHRSAIAVLPAIIGMLPMPGGAIFSAPLVAECDRENGLDPLLKTQINYWFRQVWEYWWPLYPGVLLAIQITGLEVWQFMMVLLPLSLLAIAAGYWFLLRRVPITNETEDREGEGGGSGPGLRTLLLPIAVVVAVYAILRVTVPALSQANRYLPMIIGLTVGMGVLQFQRPLSRGQWWQILGSRKTLALAVLVAMVRVYGAFIEARLPNGELLVGQMRIELESWGVPVILVIMLLPFLSGIASGLAIGFVGASFPIVFSLLGEDPALSRLLTVAVLAYGFGYMGMILSPVHICLIVTNAHFRTRIYHSIAALARPALVVLAGVVLYYLVLTLAV